MLKALSPILGEFRGKGEKADGTELDFGFYGEEVIPEVCYGFRLKVRNLETGFDSLHAYIVASQGPNGLELHCYESRIHVSELKWLHNTHAGFTSESRVYEFEAITQKGGRFRLSFDVFNAERFLVKLETSEVAGSPLVPVWMGTLDRSLGQPLSQPELRRRVA